MKHEIDNLDKKILKLISQNARIPFLEVARECNVSGAAIHQRVQKLSNIGVVRGSEFIINTYKVGFQAGTCRKNGTPSHHLLTIISFRSCKRLREKVYYL